MVVKMLCWGDSIATVLTSRFCMMEIHDLICMDQGRTSDLVTPWGLVLRMLVIPTSKNGRDRSSSYRRVLASSMYLNKCLDSGSITSYLRASEEEPILLQIEDLGSWSYWKGSRRHVQSCGVWSKPVWLNSLCIWCLGCYAWKPLKANVGT